MTHGDHSDEQFEILFWWFDAESTQNPEDELERLTQARTSRARRRRRPLRRLTERPSA